MFQKHLMLNGEFSFVPTNLFLLHTFPHLSKWKANAHSCLSQNCGHSRAFLSPYPICHLYTARKSINITSKVFLECTFAVSTITPTLSHHHLSVGLQQRPLVSLPAPTSRASVVHSPHSNRSILLQRPLG